LARVLTCWWCGFKKRTRQCSGVLRGVFPRSCSPLLLPSFPSGRRAPPSTSTARGKTTVSARRFFRPVQQPLLQCTHCLTPQLTPFVCAVSMPPGPKRGVLLHIGDTEGTAGRAAREFSHQESGGAAEGRAPAGAACSMRGCAWFLPPRLARRGRRHKQRPRKCHRVLFTSHAFACVGRLHLKRPPTPPPPRS